MGKDTGRPYLRLDEEEVKKALWRIGLNRAPGLDGITGETLRRAWAVIGRGFKRILESCLRESRFPDGWKTADVVEIRNGPDRDPCNLKSYRLVSLLPVVSKVLERLIVDRLLNEIEGNISGEQHGFTVGKSTISALKEELC